MSGEGGKLTVGKCLGRNCLNGRMFEESLGVEMFQKLSRGEISGTNCTVGNVWGKVSGWGCPVQSKCLVKNDMGNVWIPSRITSLDV